MNLIEIVIKLTKFEIKNKSKNIINPSAYFQFVHDGISSQNLYCHKITKSKLVLR